MTVADEMPPARPAATVVVVRDRPDGPEVLLLKRSEVGAFAGMWVFPGGRVDDADLGDDELGRARAAAVREALEEVAVVLDPTTLVTWAHWTPPPIQPKRFNTWFFLAVLESPAGAPDVTIDGFEIVEHRWMRPGEALAAGMPMAPPTHVTLHQLAEHSTLESIVGNGPSRGIERFATRSAAGEGEIVLLWHGDAGYDAGDPALPGPRHRMVLRGGTAHYTRD